MQKQAFGVQQESFRVLDCDRRHPLQQSVLDNYQVGQTSPLYLISKIEPRLTKVVKSHVLIFSNNFVPRVCNDLQ